VTYHDACHLAHGQRIRSQPRDLLEAIPGIEFIPLANSDRCCGSAGIYSVTQPAMAHTLRDAKWATIEATGAEIVAMGNPGCHAWLAQASRSAKSSIRVMHTAEVLECALSGC
jgi:glycolate oxidase iron-sulfur subunit